MGEIFERVVPKVPLEFTGERLTTDIDGQIQIEHLHRYFLARELCRGLDVLDVASGEGYGTALLAQTARSVVGVEVSGEAVEHAAQSYSGANFRYQHGDARSLPLPDASVDAVVSFETIEHFYEHDLFVAEVRRVLRPGGLFIVSSPDRDVFSPAGSAANGFHVHELSGQEFQNLLSAAFSHVQMLGQRPVLGSALVAEAGTEGRALTFEKRGPNHFEASAGVPRAVYWVAVASDHPVKSVPDSLYIDTDDIARVLGAAQIVDTVAAERSALLARAEQAEAARELASANLTSAIEQAGAQAETFRQQMLAMDQASHEHAARARALSDELAHLRSELANAVEQAGAQAESFRQQMLAMDQASHEHAARASTLNDELTLLKSEHANSLADAALACKQRDLARVSARRAAASEGAWRGKLAEVESRAAEAENAWNADRELWAAEAARLAQQVTEWQSHYYRLRARLDGLLRRFGVLQASRLLPQPVRRKLRDRLFNRAER